MKKSLLAAAFCMGWAFLAGPAPAQTAAPARNIIIFMADGRVKYFSKDDMLRTRVEAT